MGFKECKCEVIVGNIGTVFTGSLTKALKEYYAWVKLSRAPYGRAAYEPITLMKDGDIYKEHFPKGGKIE